MKNNEILSARAWGIIIGIVGIIIGVIFATYNWSAYAEANLTFPANTQTRYSDYLNIGSSVDVAAAQDYGSTSCKYNVYYMKRGASQWTTIKNGLNFSRNDSAKVIGSYSAGKFRDVRIKGYKTYGTSSSSKLLVYVGW
ncbi:hypothetical protein GC105_11275 [Alkalibaculum sp. M08DMB]|uniref:Uncharacterized protein n=1 Tax=Alkalibaculum sporogenes TaxID=2655001 RepID=A0A6A7KA00_9FIRM|nr:hypothetical protein [Alkalibaculum sporogenes]MPW26369.1 hypothetical protein [Alkalibaculum sporogenes]